MQLFQLRNYEVIFEPQTMMIDVFAAIRDSNKGDEELTYKEMSYIWFFADVRSDFQNVMNDDDRSEEIKLRISLPEEWKPSKEVLEAIKFYEKYSKTPSSGLYKASTTAAKFIEEKLGNPEKLLEEKNAKGEPVYKIDTVLNMIGKIPDVMEKLYKAREQVITELESKSGLKGGKEKSMFEDGI